MRTRIKALVAVVMTTAAIGGVLAAPASAVVPVVQLRIQCVSAELNTPITITFVEPAKRVGRVINDLARSTCISGTLRVLSVDEI